MVRVLTGNCLTGFGLRNFKAFRYLDDLAIRPLTVLVGANSSGKSSLIQSLLLLKQTLMSDRFTGALRFDGEWTQLRGFGSVISDFDLSRTLEYRLTLRQAELPETMGPEDVWPEFRATISFTADPETQEARLSEFRVDRLPSGVPSEEEASALVVSEGGRRFEWEGLERFCHDLDESIHPKGIALPYAGAEATADFRGFLPRSLSLHARRGDGSDQMEVPFGQLGEMGHLVDLMHTELAYGLEYLGPVRADPRPFYPVDETPDVGPRGEATIPYLLRHKGDPVTYVPTPGSVARTSTLIGAVNHWLRRMGIANGLTIRPVEAVAYVAKLRSEAIGSGLVNIASVGFGVSQLLPVLAMGLKQPNDTLLLLEQPELHLHPRLQGDLAEFLLCIALAGKRVIVETHSDHLVNRLRRCIAEDRDGSLSDLVSILFVRSGTRDDPSSYVEPLEIDPEGTIVNWPPDFLTDAGNEALAIVRAARRKGSR